MNLHTRLSAVALIATLLLFSGCIAEDFPDVSATQVDAGGDVSDAAHDTAGDADDVASDADKDTDTTVPGCRSDDECEGQDNEIGECDVETNTCFYSCEEGFDDCDGQESNGCEAQIGTVDHCGGCGFTCQPEEVTNFAPVCTDSGCSIDPDACAPGFADADGNSDNGCECEMSAPNDVPGDGDTNCDGFDGIVNGEDANVVFVDPDGSDGADGLSPTSALRSLQAAINVAADKDRSYVLAAGGSYLDIVELKDGVSIYGGYDADNDWERDIDSRETIIEPPVSAFAPNTQHYKSVSADGLTEPVRLDHVTILGVDAEGPGASSYAVWINASDDLTIYNSRVVAGAGADGRDGTDGSPRSDLSCNASGGDGGQKNSSDFQCPSQGQADSGNSGDDGTQSGTGGTGGNGGAHACNTATGCSTTAGDGGTILNGASGQTGSNGTSGTAHGEVASGVWSPSAGGEPEDGGDGGGGGGGGAGGDCKFATAYARGGAGGHGGAGGCGATRGTNGENGGGSFGIFIVNSTVEINGGKVIQNTGGQGGTGGNGAAGQEAPDTGWTPGEAVTGVSGAKNGGDGGRGGDGGHSGAGAGGCGGPSFGIAMDASNVTVTAVSSETPTQGAQGGDGGTQGGPDGAVAPQGCTGGFGFDHEFSPAPN